jgi:YD repeat-containing protein
LKDCIYQSRLGWNEEQNGILYDLVGNATQLPPQVDSDWSSSYKLEWDGWNRLVRVRQPDNTEVASYAYDGLHRRQKRTVGGTTRIAYYNDEWKMIEQVPTSGTLNAERYLWGTRHRDELIARNMLPGTL